MRTDKLLSALQSYLESETTVASSASRKAERESLHRQVMSARQQLSATNAGDQPSPAPAGKVFRQILVAVDSSEQAGFAMEVARRLARDVDGQLALIHVVSLPPVTNPDLAYEQMQFRQTSYDGGQQLLDRLARRLAGTEVEQILRQGDPATEIADAATRLGADLVVIGTHGRGRFASAVIGSVAQGVMRKATCPVLCVAHHPENGRLNAKVLAETNADYFTTLPI